MAVAPGGMFSGRGAGRVEQARLSYQNERPVGGWAVPSGAFGQRDFFHRSSNVNGAGLPALWRLPWDGRAQGPIDFEDTRTVAVLPKSTGKAFRQPAAAKFEKLARRDVAKDQCSLVDVVKRSDSGVRGDCSAERLEIRSECIGDQLRTAARDGP